MKNILNIDELKKVTGGIGRIDYPDPSNVVGPVCEIKTVGTCDPPCKKEVAGYPY